MTTPTQANPSLGAFTPGYDPIAHTTGVALRVANIQTDTSVTPNVVYGDLGVDVTVSISPTANQRVSAQSGDFVDGAIATLGAQADVSATTDTGTFTLMALFKRAVTKLTSIVTNTGNIPAQGQAAMVASLPVVIANNQSAVPISGSITATNPSVSTDGSAIPSSSTLVGASDGTNLQQLLVESASQRNLRVGIFNAGNELAVDASGRITLVPNQVVEIGDGTTPTQKLAIDASGRITLVPNSSVNAAQIGGQVPTLDNTTILAVSMRGKNSVAGDTAVLVDSSGRPQVNAAQWNGAAPSVTNPVITEDQIRAWIIAGQGFQSSTGKLTAAAATQAFSVFAPNTLTKNILIYSLKIGYSNASTMHDARVVTTDPAFANSATISNSKQGGAATNGVTSTYATTTQTASGTVFDAPETGANTPVDIFTGGQYYYIPAGTAGGLAIYFGNTAAGSLSATAKWIEI